MVPIIILIIEFIIRLRPSNKSKIFNLWLVVDKIRIGAITPLSLKHSNLDPVYSSLSSSSIGYTKP